MVRDLSANKAGSYYVTNGSELGQLNTSVAAIAAGDALLLDTADNTFKTAPTGAKGRIAGAVEAKAAGKTEVRAVVKGPIDMVADGTIRPGRRVAISGTTPGRVIEFTPAGTVADINADFGYFLGFGGNQNNNEKEGGPRTSAAAGNVVTIFIDR